MHRRTFLAVAASSTGAGCSLLRESASSRSSPDGSPESSAPVRWRYRFNPPGTPNQECRNCRGVHYPPAVVDDTVYVGGPHLAALDAAGGSERWTYETDSPVFSRPVVRDGRVLLLSGVDSGLGPTGTVHVVDTATGEGVWHDGETDASRLVAAVDGTVAVAQFDDEISPVGAYTFGLDISDGSRRWRRETGDVFGPGVGRDGTVYVAGPAALFAIDATTGEDCWRLSGVGPWGMTLGEELLYAILSEEVSALDPATGERQWRHGVPSGGDVTLAAGREVVHLALDDGPLVALDAATGEARWRASPGVPVKTLVEVDGTVYLGAATPPSVHLLAFDAATGEERWRYESDEHNLSDAVAVAVGDAVYVRFSESHGVVALDPGDGTERWRYSSDAELVGPVTGGDAVYVGTAEGELLALEA